MINELMRLLLAMILLSMIAFNYRLVYVLKEGVSNNNILTYLQYN